MKTLVAGATGQTGRHVVAQLLERGIEVRALVRDNAKAERELPSDERLKIVVGDVLKPDTLVAALADCKTVISATGASPSFDPTGPYKVDYEGTKHLVDAAKQANVEQFVMVSSLCVSRLLHPLNLFWGVLYWKQQAEEHLKRSGVPYTIVRPGGLRNEDSDQAIIMSAADTLFEGNIPRQKVAQVCAEALTQPAAQNKVVEIVTRETVAAQPLSTLFANVS